MYAYFLMDDAYGPVTCPSQLHDETLDKMLKNRDNIRIYLVTMPQSVFRQISQS